MQPLSPDEQTQILDEYVKEATLISLKYAMETPAILRRIEEKRNRRA